MNTGIASHCGRNFIGGGPWSSVIRWLQLMSQASSGATYISSILGLERLPCATGGTQARSRGANSPN
jgi:hypothetical protein